MRFQIIFAVIFFFGICSNAQTTTLSHFLEKANTENPQLISNKNLEKIGALQNKIIVAQQQAFNVNATSEVLIAPYFNTNRKTVDITTSPSPDAYGYDAGITNGGLYSAQLNITKDLFNQSATDNLLFQNKLKNKAYELNTQEVLRNLRKTITQTYIITYQFQLKVDLAETLIADLQKRLKVVEILVKHGVLSESDYSLVQLSLETQKINLKQTENNFADSYAQLCNLSGIRFKQTQELDPPELSIMSRNYSFLYEKRFKNDSLQLKADKTVFENKYKPKVSAYANAGLNAVDLERVQHSLGFSAGLRLTIPIYDGHQKKYNDQQNQYKYDNLSVVEENKGLQVMNTLKSLNNQMVNIQQSIELTENQLKIQKNVLEIYKDKFSQGQVSVVDYLNILNDFKNKQYAKLQLLTNLSLLKNQYNFTNQ